MYPCEPPLCNLLGLCPTAANDNFPPELRSRTAPQSLVSKVRKLIVFFLYLSAIGFVALSWYSLAKMSWYSLSIAVRAN